MHSLAACQYHTLRCGNISNKVSWATRSQYKFIIVTQSILSNPRTLRLGANAVRFAEVQSDHRFIELFQILSKNKDTNNMQMYICVHVSI